MSCQHFLCRQYYLTAYNALQAALWATVFIRTLLGLVHSQADLVAQVEPLARWTQTLALLDVLHAKVRLVPSGTATTFTQVGTRVIQVWVIWWAFPEAILGDSPPTDNGNSVVASSGSGAFAFIALLVAWSVADTIRYTYLLCRMHAIESQGFICLR